MGRAPAAVFALLPSAVLLLASPSCRKGSGEPAPRGNAAKKPAEGAGSRAPEAPAGDEGGCERLPFAESAPIAEASGAHYLRAAGGEAAQIVLVGDSGTGGELVRLDADRGSVLERTKLPLDGAASDDLEGLSAIGDVLYGITSSGFVRHWRRTDGGYELSREAYPIGDAGAGEVCEEGGHTNCGRNYEGLCLRLDAEPGEGACAGFAASKADGALYCLALAGDGTLALAGDKRIDVLHRKSLTGCHFAPDRDLLWGGANTIGANAVLQVRGADDPDTAEVEAVGSLGAGFPEALAIGPDGIVYRFSDTSGRPSLMNKYRCQ